MHVCEGEEEMTPEELAAEMRSRINPAYEHVIGTESYERRLCCEAIESLLEERSEFVTLLRDLKDAPYFSEYDIPTNIYERIDAFLGGKSE